VSRLDVIRRPARAGGVGIAGLALAAVTATSPVLAAADCVPTAAVFPPGTWVAHGIQIHKESSDDRSTTVIQGSGGFHLTVSEYGEASGSMSLVGTGYSQSWIEGDDSSQQVDFLVDAQLSGTGARIWADGEMALEFSGVIDSNPNGDGDSYSGSGSDLFGYGNETSIEYHRSFAPSAASCNTVFGSLDGAVEYGAEGGSDQTFFLAARVGKAPSNVDIEGQLVEILDAAEEVLAMDPVDDEILARFVYDVIAFDSLLTSLEACDFADMPSLSPAWGMLRTVLIQTADRFLDTALGGAYTTRDVIGVMAIVLQGGTLGWRGDDCIQPSASDEDGASLFVKFEDVLLARLELAASDIVHPEAKDEVQEIAAAAYQFGLPRLIAALEGR
jgi:hypothetical protein